MATTPTPMLPRERCDFSAIVDRPPLKLPGEARLAFWTIVNYEVWDIGRPMPRQVLPAPTGVPLFPDVPHWSWHEYGMRVGAWRFFELYERLGIRPTLAAKVVWVQVSTSGDTGGGAAFDSVVMAPPSRCRPNSCPRTCCRDQSPQSSAACRPHT